MISHYRNQWDQVLLINEKIITQIKEASKYTGELTVEDVAQYYILTCEDIFDNFKINEQRKIPEGMVKVPEEEPMWKMVRLMEGAVEQYKKMQERKNTFTYNALSFFNRYPVACTAALVVGSLAVGVATGCAAEYIAERWSIESNR
jgi:hypothetical protein